MKTNNIYDYVERLNNLLRADSRQAIAAHGLQPVQLEVLHYLSTCNHYSDTPMAVTEYLGQTKGTVSQTIKVLEKKGLIRKYSDKNDKRIYHLKVSATGKNLLIKTIPTAMFANACEVLPDKKKLEILDSLKQLLTTVLQINNIKTFGVCHTCRYNGKTKDDGYFCNLVQQPLTVNDVDLICREHKNQVTPNSVTKNLMK
ncbi:MarR family winged helix-turn-helix transcriptional regulator [Candidatus Thioglobus sp.]|uniref:MarR family winged helix-turn-helix transcriptional regulator n=1 Tax=Candidatus Thioglobus sp. TaxID=2026721 RepID=UPI003D0CDD50